MQLGWNSTRNPCFLDPCRWLTIKGSNFASKSARLFGSMHGITTAFVGDKCPWNHPRVHQENRPEMFTDGFCKLSPTDLGWWGYSLWKNAWELSWVKTLETMSVAEGIGWSWFLEDWGFLKETPSCRTLTTIRWLIRIHDLVSQHKSDAMDSWLLGRGQFGG